LAAAGDDRFAHPILHGGGDRGRAGAIPETADRGELRPAAKGPSLQPRLTVGQRFEMQDLVGQLGDIVKVKAGYARNYLIPQGKARRATESALKEFESRRADLEKVHGDRLQAAQALGERLGGLTVQIPARAGVDGRLFGSVTNFDIAEAVTKQGFEVAKAQVRMPQGPLKSVGDHKVALVLHTDVIVEITVSVLSDAA